MDQALSLSCPSSFLCHIMPRGSPRASNKSSPRDESPGTSLRDAAGADQNTGGGGCCSVSKSADKGVIEEYKKQLSVHEKLAKQQSTSQDSLAKEIQNVAKSAKEQQNEFERFRTALQDALGQQKTVADRLEEVIVQQQAVIDRQEDLIKQMIDGSRNGHSHTKVDIMSNMKRPRDSPQASARGGGDRDRMPRVSTVSGGDQEEDFAPDDAQVSDDGERDRGSSRRDRKKKTKKMTMDRNNSLPDMIKAAMGSSRKKTQKADKPRRKSMEGRGNIGANPAPWNKDLYEDSVRLGDEAAEEEEEEEKLFPRLARLVHSYKFKLFFALLILANTAFVAMQVQWAAKHLDTQTPPMYITVADMLFCLLFLFEIICRLLVERGKFFKSDMKYWNVFDMLLVGLAMQEQMGVYMLIAKGRTETIGADQGEKGGNFTFLRMIRILRIMRVLRVFKYMPQLTIMLQGILESMSAMIWLFALLALLMFMASLIFMSATANYFKTRQGDDDLGKEHADEMRVFFGSMTKSMLTLFKAISGGLAWDRLGDGLMKISRVYGVIFLLYISFVFFGIVNVMTGVFVISAQKTSKKTSLDTKKRDFEEMKEYLDSCTGDNDIIDRESFMFHLENEDKMKDLLKPLDLGPADAAHLFDLLAEDDAGVPNGRLTQGFLRLLGGTKTTDVIFLLWETRRLANELFSFFCFCEAHFRTISTAQGITNPTRKYLHKIADKSAEREEFEKFQKAEKEKEKEKQKAERMYS